ncbi:MAG TPA: hypothetical protein DCQ06_05805 [Myxococcales bacterium]|mgnify:CR=1 FL=1|nr:hypothetical protein [Myxococcales bacterium]HAN31095.1 hypothetical protein [Myxococcales bacterium]
MAAKGIAHADLVAAFEERWDHYSARVMAGETLANAGVTAGANYADKDLTAIVAQLEAQGGADTVVAALSGPAPAKPTPKAAEKAEPKPEAKAEPKAAKPAAKPAAKKSAAKKPAAKKSAGK